MSEKFRYIDMDGVIYDSADEANRVNQLKQEELDEARKSKERGNNPNFIQLTKGISPAILSQVAEKSAVAIQVIMFFFENMDKSNVLMVSQATIADTIERSRKAISEAIKVLEEFGAIGIGKVSNSNVYLINPNMVWQDAHHRKNTVVLKGNIILGKDENKALFKRFNNTIEKAKEHSLSVGSVNTKISRPTPQAKQTQPEHQPSEEQIVQDEKAQQLYEDFEENFLTPEEQDIEDMV